MFYIRCVGKQCTTQIYFVLSGRRKCLLQVLFHQNQNLNKKIKFHTLSTFLLTASKSNPNTDNY